MQGEQGQGLGAGAAFPGKMPGTELKEQSAWIEVCDANVSASLSLSARPGCDDGCVHSAAVWESVIDGHRCGPRGGCMCHLSPLAGHVVGFLQVRRNGELGNFDRGALTFSLVSEAHSSNRHL